MLHDEQTDSVNRNCSFNVGFHIFTLHLPKIYFNISIPFSKHYTQIWGCPENFRIYSLITNLMSVLTLQKNYHHFEGKKYCPAAQEICILLTELLINIKVHEQTK